jgi:hypothetical protein
MASIPTAEEPLVFANQGPLRFPIERHHDQLTRVTSQLSDRFCSIHKWHPRAFLGVESSAEENVDLSLAVK